MPFCRNAFLLFSRSQNLTLFLGLLGAVHATSTSHNLRYRIVVAIMTAQVPHTPRRRSSAFKVVTCCVICVSLLLQLPTQDNVASTEASLKDKRKNFTKEAIAASNMSLSTIRQYLASKNSSSSAPSDAVGMDFFVAGFAKCGTTSLLKTFEAHNETAVAPKEECSLDVIKDDTVARSNVIKALTNASSLVNVKRGIKCPFSFTSDDALPRLDEWFPSTKLIFGLRHPVALFESYFNYRVLTYYAGKIKGPIPPAETLLHSNAWERVSTDYTKFETILKKLVSLNKPPPKIFLYTLEQMKDETENKALRETLASFLELKHPIQPLPQVNVNPHVGDQGYEETIDICDSRYDELRSILTSNGRKTQQWIRDNLLPNATVANLEGFVNMLKQWGTDPCKVVEQDMEEAE